MEEGIPEPPTLPNRPLDEDQPMVVRMPRPESKPIAKDPEPRTKEPRGGDFEKRDGDDKTMAGGAAAKIRAGLASAALAYISQY